jgi:GxxExxY protein
VAISAFVAKENIMSELIYKEESYQIIGLCMEVHNQLGHGFAEIVYKDALEYEFNLNKVKYQREKEYSVNYKGKILEHQFYADFVVFDKIILEIKCVKSLVDEHESQAINYLKVSNNRLALLVNFSRGKLEHKRIIY